MKSTREKKKTCVIAITLSCLMCLVLGIIPGADAAKGYIDFESIKIQSTAAKYNGQPNRWGLGNHGRYLAQDFKIKTGGIVSKDDIKKNTYAFCMQPNMTGPWRYGGGGKTFSVDHQYGPYNDLGDKWSELGDNEEETEKWQSKFKSKKTKEIDGSEYNRMGLILRYIMYYAPGGQGWKKGYGGDKAGKDWSVYNKDGSVRSLSECYDIAHILACIWRADYKDDGTDCISWNDAVSTISSGAHSYMNTATFRSGAKFIYDFYKKAFYDTVDADHDGDSDTTKVDYDKLYEGVPKTYVAGYFVCEGDNQDFATGFNPDIPSSRISVAKKSSSTRITIADLEDGTDEELDETALHSALQEILDFLESNKLYSLEGTQIKLTGPGVPSDKNTKVIKKSNDHEIEWDSEDSEMSTSGGEYTLQEVKASKGYKLDQTKRSKTLKKNDDADVVMYNDPVTIPLGIRMNIKESLLRNENTLSPGKEPYDLTSKFRIEYWDSTVHAEPGRAAEIMGSPRASFTIRTGKDGSAVLDDDNISFDPEDASGKKFFRRFMQGEGLPLGYYRVTETEPPKGFRLNSNPAAFIFDDSDEYTKADRPVFYYRYNNVRSSWSAAVTLGGCDSLTNAAISGKLKNEEATNSDEPYYIGLIAEKRDNDTFKTNPQGDVHDFSNISFEIINNGPDIDTQFDVSGNRLAPDRARKVGHGEIIYKGKADENGQIRTKGENNGRILPVADASFGGTEYILRESESCEGYHKNSGWQIKVSRNQAEYSDDLTGEIIDTRSATDRVISENSGLIENKVFRGGIKICKNDFYLDRSEAMNGKNHNASDHEGTDLNNIRFLIRNRSEHEVVVPYDIDAGIPGSKAPVDIDHSVRPGAFTDERLIVVAPGQIVGTITTAWDDNEKAYIAKTQNDALPYGTYEIEECSTNRYYQLSDKAKRIVSIREDGETVVKDNDGEPLTWKDKPWRQNITIRKSMDSTNVPGAYIPFKVTSTTTGEYHYFVTDSNGEFDSEDDRGEDAKKHSNNTNGYDSYIDGCISEGKTVDSNELSKMRLSEDGNEITAPGLWFGKGEDGSQQSVDDSIAALPYGGYDLEEIKCTNNDGKTMIKKHFFIGKDESKVMLNDSKKVDLGTVKNSSIELKTSAKCDQTGDHKAPLAEKTTITDTVSYKGLTEGKKYIFKGILMKKVKYEDSYIGIPLFDQDGNQIRKETEFTAAAGGSGTVDLTYELDSRLLSGVTTVVFEDLYEDDVLIGTHSDIEDKGQTVDFQKKVESETPDTPEEPKADEPKVKEKLPGLSFSAHKQKKKPVHKKRTKNSPKTGDELPLPLYLAVAVISMAALFTGMKGMKRK